MLTVQFQGNTKNFDGTEVRVARVRAAFTLDDLGRETGIQVSELSRYERNRQVPSDGHLVKLLAFAPDCLKEVTRD